MSVMLSYVCIPALLYHVYIHDRFHLISQDIAHQQLFKTRLSYIVSEFSLITFCALCVHVVLFNVSRRCFYI